MFNLFLFIGMRISLTAVFVKGLALLHELLVFIVVFIQRFLLLLKFDSEGLLVLDNPVGNLLRSDVIEGVSDGNGLIDSKLFRDVVLIDGCILLEYRIFNGVGDVEHFLNI